MVRIGLAATLGYNFICQFTFTGSLGLEIVFVTLMLRPPFRLGAGSAPTSCLNAIETCFRKAKTWDLQPSQSGGIIILFVAMTIAQLTLSKRVAYLRSRAKS